MNARLFHVLIAGLAVVGASAIGCRSRALDPGAGPGTLGRDAGGGGAGGGSDAGTDPDRRPTSTLGQACRTAGDCVSGFCAEGVCCDADCLGICQTCASPGMLGICVFRLAGQQPRTFGACPVEIAESCGHDGTCDGQGACRLRPSNTPCGGGMCDGDAVVGRNVCDGTGNCRPGPTQICVPFRCDTATASCRAGCTTDADCAAGIPCLNGSCMRTPHATCASDQECASGHCVQGVCCNNACGGPCLACNLQGREGTCSPRPSGTNCGSPSCQAGVVTGLERCDTAGQCEDWASVICSPFTCDPSTNLCRDSCAGDADCAPTWVCANGSCGRRESHTCDNGGQCDTGWCSRGICCDSACNDPCHSCSLPGSIGVCTAVGEDCFASLSDL